MASNARAKTPAASGAAADVPEWVFVHFPYKSVVAYVRNDSNNMIDCYTKIKGLIWWLNLKLIDWLINKLTTPVWGSFAPLLKVDANVDEHDSS